MQEPVTRPKFNQDLPADYLGEHTTDISFVDGINSGKQPHN